MITEVQEQQQHYLYHVMADAPIQHHRIATMTSHKVPPLAIATHLRCSVRTVNQVIKHPPVAAHIRGLYDANREEMICGFEAHLIGINLAPQVLLEIMTDPKVAATVRVSVAKFCMEHDPTGLYHKKNGLKDGDENKRVFDQDAQTELIQRSEEFGTIARFDEMPAQQETDDDEEDRDPRDDTKGFIEVSVDFGDAGKVR